LLPDCFDVRFPWRRHPGAGPEHGNIRRQEADLFDFGDIGRGHMVGEDLAEVAGNLGRVVHLAAIEPDDIAVIQESSANVLVFRWFQASSKRW